MKIRRWLLALAGLLVLIQIFRIDKSTPAIDPAQDFIAIAAPPPELQQVLKAACYDCHSFETRYPWYAEVAPVSWWLKHHVDEGREHLNFSTFGSLSDRDQLHALEESVEMVEEGEMPLGSYTWTHADARLSDAQKAQLVAWMKGFGAVGVNWHE
ncbi:MAG: heme-binding domain-containing protein [Saprospiraceae bacterium]|nr:heme-binding domain-containing protein [Saprospiraceae bacterium]